MPFVRVVQNVTQSSPLSTISGLFSRWHSLEQRVNCVPRENFTENPFWLIFSQLLPFGSLLALHFFTQQKEKSSFNVTEK